MTIRTVLFWMAAACCVVAELAILRSLIFGRAGAATAARSADRPGAPSAPNRATEMVWAFLPAIGLALVLYMTWRAVDTPRPPSPDTGRAGVTIGA